MTEAEKVLAIALGEVGYLEKETNTSLDHATANAGDENYTKYARDLDAIHFYNGRKNGHAWCDVFVDWCFVQVFGEEGAKERTFQPRIFLFNKGAGSAIATATMLRRAVPMKHPWWETRSSSQEAPASASATRVWCTAWMKTTSILWRATPPPKKV